MKNLVVYDLSGKKLFEGSRHDCKAYIRKNRINRYTMKETFIEKVIIVDEPEKIEEVEEVETVKESLFNRVFGGV